MNDKKKLKDDVKRQYIFEGLSPAEISHLYGYSPSVRTIQKWASDTGENGLTWKEQRRNRLGNERKSLIPRLMADKLYRKMLLLADKPDEEFTVKDGEMVVKLQKLLTQHTEGKHLAPVVNMILIDQMNFFEERYPGLITAKLVEAFNKYREIVRQRYNA